MPKAQKSDEFESFGRKNPMLLSMYVLLILVKCAFTSYHAANPVCSFFSHTLLLHTYSPHLRLVYHPSVIIPWQPGAHLILSCHVH